MIKGEGEIPQAAKNEHNTLTSTTGFRSVGPIFLWFKCILKIMACYIRCIDTMFKKKYINYILNKSTKHFAVFKKTGASDGKNK